jgi:hypothetical protein
MKHIATSVADVLDGTLPLSHTEASFMTFTEAAEAVLRKMGKALHVKKITQLAIDENLLSHVGKTPEVTMSTRLATLTKKDRGDQNIVRVRPGVFGLREWGNNVPVDAEAANEPEVESADGDNEVEDVAAPTPPPAPKAPAQTQQPQHAPRNDGRGGDRRDGKRDGRDNRGNDRRGDKRDARPGERADNRNLSRGDGRRDDPRARGGRDDRRDRRGSSKPAEVVPSEAPAAAIESVVDVKNDATVTEAIGAITHTETETTVAEVIGVAAAEAVAHEAAESSVSEAAAEVHEEVAEAIGASAAAVAAESVVGTEAGEELTAMEVASAPRPLPRVRADADFEEDARPRDADEVEREERLAAAADMFPEEDDDEEPLLGGASESDNNRRRRRRRRRGRGPDGGAETSTAPEGAEPVTETRPARHDEGRDRDRDRDRRERDETPRDDETGRDAADLLVSLLTRRDDRQPVPMRALVDEALRFGRISGDPQLHVPALTAAARIDAVRRASRGERPRLRVTGGRVGLMDWTFPTELVRAEADALAALERLREAARRYVVRRLNELPQASFTEVVVMLLERMGISSLKAARRPGLPQGEVHLAGVARRGPEELPLAVVVKRGGEVGRERVIELRGSLHHYGPATAAWVVTTGNVLSGARDEAQQAGVAPVTLLDASSLGRLLDEHGVLVSHASVSLPWLDVDLYDMLRGS